MTMPFDYRKEALGKLHKAISCLQYMHVDDYYDSESKRAKDLLIEAQMLIVELDRETTNRRTEQWWQQQKVTKQA